MNWIKSSLFKLFPSDFFSKKYPVSVKGIVILNNRVVLLKNEREEWELPGGKIELNETAEECTIREIKEELNIDSEIMSLIDVWMYNILGKVNVLIVTYLCKPIISNSLDIQISHEHKEVRLYDFDEIKDIKMPEGYKNSIFKALKTLSYE